MKIFIVAVLLFCALVSAQAQVKITTTSLPNGGIGTSYAATVNTSGGSTPFIWSLSVGSLPPGIGLTPSSDTRSATIAGMPSTANTYGFTVAVKGHGGHVATQTYNVTIKPLPTLALTVSIAGTGSGTVTSKPTGINCPGICSANFSSGASVTLTATPAGGSTFAGWSGACSGTGTCSVTMSAVRSVTATFNVMTFHTVDLTWDASTSGNIVGYNVYRSAISGGPYSLINSGLIAATLYTDATVANTTTYFYVVTTVDNTGAESGYSNQATAVVP